MGIIRILNSGVLVIENGGIAQTGGLPPPSFAPDDISDLLIWWDVSEAQYVWSDSLRTVQITDGELVRAVTDRSGSNSHAKVDSDGSRPTWNANTQNSLATLDCNSDPAGGAPRAIETDQIRAGIETQPYTIVGVARQAPPDVSEREALFSMTQSVGTELRLNRIGDGSNFEMTTILGGNTSEGLQEPPTGDWYMYLMTVDGASSLIEYGSKGSAAIQVDSLPFTHDAGATVPNTFRFGAGVDGIPNIRSGWNSLIGEVLYYEKALSGAEKLTLLAYFSSKWDLATSTITA